MNIRTAEAQDRSAVLDVLTLAFAADPVVRYWWPVAADFLHWWPRYVEAMGDTGLSGGTATIAEGQEGAAIWLAPGVEPDPERIAALGLTRSEEEARVGAALRSEMERYHPAQPHWYLWTLGVDPRTQGRGVGSAVLRHTLARIDAEGAVAYLEASDPKNVPFYERHGFEALGLIQVADIPPLVPMIRRPA